MPTTLSFLALLLLISFASVNAVLFTPALPNIAIFFNISDDLAQLTISWFLIGYACGQLIYGPLANRFGRKPALDLGIILQILSSMLCIFAGAKGSFGLLVTGRFFLAIGSGVGLKMTFTLINEYYKPQLASQILSYLMLAFALTPGLSVALGGFLTSYWGWNSCFYACALYGILLLLLVRVLPETLKEVDINALKPMHLLQSYGSQFKNSQLVLGGLLMGCASCFVYLFAAEAPFIAINGFGLSSIHYGLANCLPPIGLIFGSLVNARLLSKNYTFHELINRGIVISTSGVIIMIVTVLMNLPVLYSLFLPTILIYFGLCFILSNASAIALSQVQDKAQGSAVMSFINLGFTTLVVLSLGLFPITRLLLPANFLALCFVMILIKNVGKNSCLITKRG